jgi:hypothetical protein
VKASRRSWSREEKRPIVEEASRPGTSVADVARRHGLNSNQVFNWRKLWGTPPAADAGCPAVPRAQPDASPAYVPEGFVSIGVITETKDIGAIPRPDPSTLLVAPQDRGAERVGAWIYRRLWGWYVHSCKTRSGRCRGEVSTDGTVIGWTIGWDVSAAYGSGNPCHTHSTKAAATRFPRPNIG